ncbi:MAG TPA: hypothetical protein VMM82_13610, partial [Spirochaetia bacterium]|nr:hypothetical protein [Spirochaetia bacterium]
MIGLLAKAKQLRGGREEIVFDPDSGISREEQKEVLQEIDGIATQNRMKVTPDLFTVRAVKRGVLFPLIVIAAAVFASGLGVLTFYLLFQQGETQLTSEQGASITAEGKLIEQVKKESAQRLEAKNQQINEIQGRLAEIDKERRDLQSNMDARVGQKEQELRAAMTQELDAERAKLQKQGLSDQAIARRLQDLEAQKNADSARQLESFRRQAEAERAKAEQNLKNMETQFNTNLAQANAERQQVLADSRKREEDLRSQLEQKTQVLESENAKTQQALSSLSTRQQQEDLVSSQLIGLYAVARTDIAQKNYPKALQSLKAVGDYVNSQDVAALPGIAKRRDFDLFVVDSLTALVQTEMNKGAAETAVAPPAQMAELSKLVGDADDLLRAGKADEAEKAYGEALQLIPEISRSYAYVVKRDHDAETARQARLRDQLARAEAAFDAGRFPQAVGAYRDALAYLPETPERIDRILSNLSAAGANAGAQKLSPAQEREAAAALTRARGLQAQGSLDEALSAYLQIVSRYPQSAQVDAAVQGIQGTVKTMNDKAAADAVKAQAALSAQIASLQADLAKARQQASTAGTRQPAGTTEQPASAGAGLSAADSQKLKDFQDRFSALEQAYTAYTSREDPVLSNRGDRGLVDTKTYLDSFLGSPPLESAF